MPVSIEERVAYLEGRVEEHSRAWKDIAERLDRVEKRIDALDQKVDRFREELSGRIDALDERLSSRIDALDGKVERLREELSSRIDALDQRLSSRIDALDQKLSRYTLWIIGIQVTILLAIVATLWRP